jgi:membrane protein YdbS with pleckstrin-like domain
MYDLLRGWALAILKAPPEPHPPFGDPASLRVFNAGRNYFRLRMAGWAVTQILALAGIIFWTAFLIEVEGMARVQKEDRANRRANVGTAEMGRDQTSANTRRRGESWQRDAVERVRTAATAPGASKKKKRIKGWAGFKQASAELALLLPAGGFGLIWGLKIFSALAYLAQIPLTYAVRRLDYEMRWYMVTDRSLRLRHGVWKISESTMSFANIQQVVVSQGPLQRLLGLADVKVKSAGGGGGGGHHQHHGADMHTGLFHSVTNASEIRDLILDRLRRFRETGLGDPDDKVAPHAGTPARPCMISADALSAARELAAEARALRAVLR